MQATRHGSHKATACRAICDFRFFSFWKIFAFLSNPATMLFNSTTLRIRFQHGNSHKKSPQNLTHCTYALSDAKILIWTAFRILLVIVYNKVSKKARLNSKPFYKVFSPCPFSPFANLPGVVLHSCRKLRMRLLLSPKPQSSAVSCTVFPSRRSRCACLVR